MNNNYKVGDVIPIRTETGYDCDGKVLEVKFDSAIVEYKVVGKKYKAKVPRLFVN